MTNACPKVVVHFFAPSFLLVQKRTQLTEQRARFMSQLIHFIYASAATHSFDTPELSDLLTISRINNQRLDVTGILLYVEGSFFQVLEGTQPSVEFLFDKIARNPGHSHVTRIISEAIPARAFADWSMGFSTLTHTEVSNLTGLNQFGSQPSSLTSLANGRARKLVHAFREGRWRMNLTGKREVAA